MASMEANTVTDRNRAARQPANNRSKFSNNPRRIAGVDQRTAGGRRLRDLIDDITADLGGVALTTVERGVVAQAAGLVLRSEQLQSDIAKGLPVDVDEVVRCANASARLLASLRSRKRQRAPASGPSFAETLRRYEAK